ncbi:hypothetical protein K2173_022428 [Erythroxylum novogranatense]|uniref:B-like cyclin n=1 Tax=Erythroxylum novogranatense TaxID=1862640 RepID=A0AAV8TJS8_9ROSI|nr:hypothetical protein K2173_022428 [Erythroxylum novogranatense]
MSFPRNYYVQGGNFQDDCSSSLNRNSFNNRNRNMNMNMNMNMNLNLNRNYNYNHDWNHTNAHEFSRRSRDHKNIDSSYFNHPNGAPSLKRRKFSSGAWEDSVRHYVQPNSYQDAALTSCSNLAPPMRSNPKASTSSIHKRDRSKLEDDEPEFFSRDEIERYSPSRKDGIDALREAHLRYSYCAFIQHLGMRLDLPQTTIGTAMVLCHRFFVRRSHANHDRFLIATAALFLAAKSEETPRPLNNVLKASCEIFHKQDIAFLTYLLPFDWLEKYRERVADAEHLILTTLNFELNVQHPYASLTSVLNKLGLSQSLLVNLALNLVSEGLRSSLWLQFKPHHIAAGAAYLAAKFLNLDLASYQNLWQEFQATPIILQDVAQQLMELFL